MTDVFDPDPLPITVPLALHEAMVAAMGAPIAVSYLCGATVINGVLHTRTHFALGKLVGSREAMGVLAEQKIRLGAVQTEADRRVIPAVETVKADRKRRRFRSYEGWGG